MNSLAARTFWTYKVIMSTLNGPKKMGRPPIDSEAVKVRLDRSILTNLDIWIAQQPDNPTRPEAIRRVLREAFRSS